MAFRTNKKLITALGELGLLTNLKLCLDAGDASSYTSGQSWLDVSGNGSDFFVGATVGAEGSDPTFNGVAGSLTPNEYWSFDGGDYFRYDSANETWMTNMHKDSAAFTLVTWTYINALGTANGLAGTRGASAGNTGVIFFKAADETLNLFVNNAGVSVANHGTSLGAIAKVGWNFFACSIDETDAATGAKFNVNGVSESYDGTYTAPSAGAASFTMEIAARGNANTPMQNLDRMGAFMAWDRALSSAELMSIYQYPYVTYSGVGGPRHRVSMEGY